MSGKPAVFLDRDGTLIEDVHYLSRLEDIRPMPGAAECLGRLRAAGFAVVLITNQSGVARGYFSEEFVKQAHERLEDILGFRFDGIYYCPHGPDEGCGCRKPATGMAESAVRELNIDLAASFVIGDKPADIELALAAGMRGVLVLTGYGRESEGSVRAAYVAHDLKDACAWIAGGV